MNKTVFMMTFSFLNQLRDDFNEWSHHRVWLRNKKVNILKTLNLRPYLLPDTGNCFEGANSPFSMFSKFIKMQIFFVKLIIAYDVMGVCRLNAKVVE